LANVPDEAGTGARESGLRKTGIGILGDLPWGTHVCHFYETKQDLLDVLIPYFQAGLENNEFCVWAVLDPLNEEEAKSALAHVFPQADRRIAAGDIEIVPYDQWYLPGGSFDVERVLGAELERLSQALARGYAGMRLNGNEAWLTKSDWTNFRQYEEKLDQLIVGQPMMVLCSYPLAAAKAGLTFDIARIHQLAIAKRQGRWEVIETAEIQQAKAEIKKLNEELEQRVRERTRELEVINESLRAEVKERQNAEEALRLSEERSRRYFELGLIGMAITSPTKGILEVNNYICEMLGYERSELLQMSWEDLTHPDDLGADLARFNRVLAGEIDGYTIDKRFLRKDGRVIDSTISVKCVRRADGSVDYFVAFLQDFTARKQAEQRIKVTNEQLRALSESLQRVREEESTRIAREIHDELGSALSGLKWDLEGLDRTIPESADISQSSALREKIGAMQQRIHTTIDAVRRIASELRPSILDDLGLVEAMEWQAERFQARTGIRTHVVSSVETVDLNAQQSTAVFRIFQEALTNVLRHSEATRVDIQVEEEPGWLRITIQDNGRGITDAQKSAAQSLGLLGMQERARLAGGSIEISGEEGKGTVVTMRVPLAHHDRQ
jgi:PAS domain S-box-containing protein